MDDKDIYDLTEGYRFEAYEEGIIMGLFLVVKELKTLNTTLKKMEKK